MYISKFSHLLRFDVMFTGSGLAEFEGDSVHENVLVMGCLLNFHTYLMNLHVSIVSECLVPGTTTRYKHDT